MVEDRSFQVPHSHSYIDTRAATPTSTVLRTLHARGCSTYIMAIARYSSFCNIVLKLLSNIHVKFGSIPCGIIPG